MFRYINSIHIKWWPKWIRINTFFNKCDVSRHLVVLNYFESRTNDDQSRETVKAIKQMMIEERRRNGEAFDAEEMDKIDAH